MALFTSPSKAVKTIDFNAIQARTWTDDDCLKYKEKKAIKCAEVLVLNKIPTEYLIKIKVSSQTAKKNVESLQIGVPVEIDKDMFFQ